MVVTVMMAVAVVVVTQKKGEEAEGDFLTIVSQSIPRDLNCRDFPVASTVGSNSSNFHRVSHLFIKRHTPHPSLRVHWTNACPRA